MAGGGLRLRGLARCRRRGRGHQPGERHRVAVQRGSRCTRKLGQCARVAMHGHARKDVVVDTAVEVQRTGAQPRSQTCDDGLVGAERSPERMGLCAAVAAEDHRARAAVEHERAQAVGVPGCVRQRDARAVTGPVELDVADPQRGAHGIEVPAAAPAP